MSIYVVPDASVFIMTDNLAVDGEPSGIALGLVANVTVKESEFDTYALLDVTTEDGDGAGLYLNRDGILALITALAQVADKLA